MRLDFAAHLLAVSQPAVAVLAATALMSEDSNPARPRSLTLIGGPVDARITPTQEQSLTRVLPLAWFASNAVGRVPAQYPGAGRRVRPGAQQMANSVLADLNRHMAAQVDQLGNLVGGNEAAAEAHRRRYAELLAFMDVPAELYLDTIHRVFQTHELARGRMAWRGREVRPEAIRDTALLVIEGDRDGSCPPGQGRAALRLCTGLDAAMKRYHLQPGAGHETLFEGRWGRRRSTRLYGISSGTRRDTGTCWEPGPTSGYAELRWRSLPHTVRYAVALCRLGYRFDYRQMRPETYSILCLHFDPQAFATVHGAHHRAAPLDANAGSDCLKPNCLASLELISHAGSFTRDELHPAFPGHPFVRRETDMMKSSMNEIDRTSLRDGPVVSEGGRSPSPLSTGQRDQERVGRRARWRRASAGARRASARWCCG